MTTMPTFMPLEIGRTGASHAGAVVTGDLPFYSIAVGTPARVVGRRK